MICHEPPRCVPVKPRQTFPFVAWIRRAFPEICWDSSLTAIIKTLVHLLEITPIQCKILLSVLFSYS